jgi:hypothetical protein
LATSPVVKTSFTLFVVVVVVLIIELSPERDFLRLSPGPRIAEESCGVGRAIALLVLPTAGEVRLTLFISSRPAHALGPDAQFLPSAAEEVANVILSEAAHVTQFT